MGKDDAPQGPDFNKLLGKVQKYVDQNQDLFQEAMKFGKANFSKGEEWVQKLTDFGMGAMGKLGSEAENFKATTAQRVAGLDKAGAQWGKQATGIYGQNKALADKVTGKLMPGMRESAELGGDLLSSYQKQGIPFQDEYIAKLAGWDTTGRREDRAAQAVSDVALTSEAARESELRRLESFGIDPSQTRSAALDSRIQAQNAVAKAQAANAQRVAVEQEGIQAGGVASDMYNQRMQAGLGSIESAGQQGRTIAEIARQPGADYLTQLAALGQYGVNVGGLEQAGGRAAFDMGNVAAGFGERGTAAGAGQRNTVSNYGSSVYDQAAKINAGSANMLGGGYQTAGSLHANDLEANRQNNENSFGATLGTLAGVAAPFIPGIGPALKAGISAVGAGVGSGGGTNLTNVAQPSAYGPFATYRSQGGPVRTEESPSKGAIPDDVPSFVDAGEYIFDRDTARWFGEKHLRNMQAQAKKGLGIPEAA